MRSVVTTRAEVLLVPLDVRARLVGDHQVTVLELEGFGEHRVLISLRKSQADDLLCIPNVKPTIG
jgi:hypothetical protein